MPRRRVASKKRVNELTNDQFWELLLGPFGEHVSAFASDRERRQMWLQHRDSIVADLGGQMAWAQEQYERARSEAGN